MVVRRCPTLPHCFRCSTIGAVRLSFRVRNVAGRFPDAMTAVTWSTLWVSLCHNMVRVVVVGVWLWVGNRAVDASIVFVCVLLSCRLISTGQLRTLLCFHVRPINPVV